MPEAKFWTSEYAEWFHQQKIRDEDIYYQKDVGACLAFLCYDLFSAVSQ